MTDDNQLPVLFQITRIEAMNLPITALDPDVPPGYNEFVREQREKDRTEMKKKLEDEDKIAKAYTSVQVVDALGNRILCTQDPHCTRFNCKLAHPRRDRARMEANPCTAFAKYDKRSNTSGKW